VRYRAKQTDTQTNKGKNPTTTTIGVGDDTDDPTAHICVRTDNNGLLIHVT